MNIQKKFLLSLNCICDSNSDISHKIESLKELTILLNGIKRLSQYEIFVLQTLADELNANAPSEYIIKHLSNEIKVFLGLQNCNESNLPRIVLINDNKNIISSFKDYLDTQNIPYINESQLNINLLLEYDAFFFFYDENNEIPTIIKHIPFERIINIHTLFFSDFFIAPAQKSICFEFEKRIAKISPHVLVTGLSYGRDAIHCDLLSTDTVTIANSGQDIYYDYLWLKHILKKALPLEAIIYVLSPYSLRYDESMSKSQDPSILLYNTIFRNIHNNNRLNAIVKEYEREREKADRILGSWKNASDWIYENKISKKDWFNKKDIFDENNVPPEESQQLQRRYNKPYENTLLENKQLLKDFCSLASEHNLKLLFFIPPFSEYYKSFWNEDYHNELMNYMNELDSIFAIDCIDLSHSILPNHWFRDSGHLNRIGAIYISQIINEWLTNNSIT